jgi:hypothetical protein
LAPRSFRGTGDTAEAEADTVAAVETEEEQASVDWVAEAALVATGEGCDGIRPPLAG